MGGEEGEGCVAFALRLRDWLLLVLEFKVNRTYCVTCFRLEDVGGIF